MSRFTLFVSATLLMVFTAVLGVLTVRDVHEANEAHVEAAARTQGLLVTLAGLLGGLAMALLIKRTRPHVA
jgi:hypothetical protein